MKFPVKVQRYAADGWRASEMFDDEAFAVGSTQEEALSRLRERMTEWYCLPIEFTSVEVVRSVNVDPVWCAAFAHAMAMTCDLRVDRCRREQNALGLSWDLGLEHEAPHDSHVRDAKNWADTVLAAARRAEDLR